MAKLFVVVLLVVTVVLPHISQAHPLTLFRITRDTQGNVQSVEEADAEEFVAQEGQQSPIGDQLITRALVERSEPVVFDIAYPGTNEEDLVVAETHIFRPLFTYRQQVSKRLKLKKLAGEKK